MIPASKPYLGDEELNNIRDVLKSGWLGMGDKVFQLETKLKQLLGRKHAICVSTGTSAIHLAIDALGIGPGDEVIVPSFTFIGSIQPIILCGAKPVFCDIELWDLNISADHFKKLITKKTKAVIPVHYGGAPCDMKSIMKTAMERGIAVIEDAAHAFGSKYAGKLIGSFGEITCFSFDPIKTLTCGEGGAVVLDDDRVADIIIKKRLLGIDKDTWNRYKHKRSWFYEVQMSGYRYHMSNINAAIGLAQFDRMDYLINERRKLAAFYDSQLKHVKGVKLLKKNVEDIAPFNYTILADKRNELMDYLEKDGIGTIINYIPNHAQPLFSSEKYDLPNTDEAYSKIVSIPMFAGLSNEDAGRVVGSIKKFYGAA